MKRSTAAALSLALVLLSGRSGAGDISIVEPTAKISSQLVAKVASDGAQDLIVVFDDEAVQAEAKSLQTTWRLPPGDQMIGNLRALRLKERKSQVFAKVDSADASVLREYDHLPISFVRVHSAQALNKLLAHPGVAGVYEDRVFHRTNLAQSLPLIKQPQAAAVGSRGTGTTVAVLDQRVDYTNAAFGPCSAPGLPSGCKVLVAQDVPGLVNDGLGYQDGHGTNVAATVLAVAPGSNVISLNVFNGEHANTHDIASAIEWCVANASKYNIVAMNLSLGSGGDTAPSTSLDYYTQFSHARAAGILPVAAAGNNGYTNAISQPASVVGAVSVGAVYDSAFGSMGPWEDANCTDSATMADKITCFSNSASFLTLLAPGCRDDAGTAPAYHCGTSQAAPHVAGAVAVLRSAFPTDTLDQTVARLTTGVSITDYRNGVTKPRLDLAKALSLPACSYSVSPTSQSIGANGTSGGTISVTAGAGCSWSASDNANWISVLSGSSGNGSGQVQYFVAKNSNATSRTGTITVAGKTVTITQEPGYKSVSSTSNIWLVNNYSYSYTNLSYVTLHADEIDNWSLARTTGTLRLELWLSNSPFTDAGGTGWPVATYQISLSESPHGTLPPLSWFTNVGAIVPFVGLPAPGSYSVSLLVTEYDPSCNYSDHFCMVALGNFSGKFFVPDVTPPTAPSGLTATPVSSTQVNLNWNASSDDAGVTSYKVFNGGVLLGRVSSSGATVSALSAATNYQFTVSACDAAQNCSAQTARVAVSTPGVAPGATCAQSPVYRYRNTVSGQPSHVAGAS